MGYARIEVEPLTSTIGAEVTGVDLRETLDDDTVAEIRAAWLEHKVLFFPNQPVTREQHKRFALCFGELYQHPYLKDVTEDPDFVELYSGGDTGSRYLSSAWHTDVTFTECPPRGSVLHAVHVPQFGGDTMWIDLEAAYRELSSVMRGLLSELFAVHSAPRTGFIPDDTSGDYITSTHPVVRTHPETGHKCLFVNPGFTRSIDGMRGKESYALLSFLHDHCQQPEYQVRYHWTPDTVAMWDNCCTQHKVVTDNRDALRKMERLTLQGTTPY